MKNTYRYLLFIVVLIGFSFSMEAQYRRYAPRKFKKDSYDRYGDPISDTKKTKKTKIKKKKSPKGKTEDSEFTYDIYYTDIQVLLNMQSAIDAAQRAAVDKWLRKQESNFTKEINRQLGTKHTSFKNAQKDFFKNYEKTFKNIEASAYKIASDYGKKVQILVTEQEKYTNEFFLIEEWRYKRDHCRPRGIIDCGELSNTKVRGTRLGSTGTAKLNRLWESSLVDFSKKEYGAAQNLSWSQGMSKIAGDGSLTTTMVNKHIANYNRKGLQDKIFLMTAYLTQYNNRSSGPLSMPIPKYRLPDFWNNSILLALGKKKAPMLTDSQKIFEKYFFENEAERCNYQRSSFLAKQCGRNYKRLAKLKEDIVQEHLSELRNNSEFGLTLGLDKIKKATGYRRGNGPGKIGGLDALSYKNYHLDGKGPNRFYELANGGWVYRSNSPRGGINGGVSFSEPSLNDDNHYYYIYNENIKKWHEFLLPSKGVDMMTDPHLIKIFWEGMKGVARYALPLEDVIILIDGKDFDGNDVSRAEAGIWLVVSIVPGGKILKPVTKFGSKVSKVVIKIGGKTVIQNITSIEKFIIVLKRKNINVFFSSTFAEGAYRTVKSNVDINLYRSFGKPISADGRFARIDGAFATTRKGATRNELAILNDFNNSMRFEAKMKVPAGTTLNIGKVAPQVSKDGLQRLSGGGDQVLLPNKWNINWVTEVIDTKTESRYTLAEFKKKFPNLFKR